VIDRLNAAVERAGITVAITYRNAERAADAMAEADRVLATSRAMLATLDQLLGQLREASSTTARPRDGEPPPR
jgi:hypothetical protein